MRQECAMLMFAILYKIIAFTKIVCLKSKHIFACLYYLHQHTNTHFCVHTHRITHKWTCVHSTHTHTLSRELPVSTARKIQVGCNLSKRWGWDTVVFAPLGAIINQRAEWKGGECDGVRRVKPWEGWRPPDCLGELEWGLSSSRWAAHGSFIFSLDSFFPPPSWQQALSLKQGEQGALSISQPDTRSL